MFYRIGRDEKKNVLQYLMLAQSVFHCQFCFTYIFSVSLKFGAYYIKGQNKRMLLYVYKYFCVILLLFYIKKFVFLSSSFPFLMKNQISATKYSPVWNRNWWWEIASGTVCITSKYNPHFDDYINLGDLHKWWCFKKFPNTGIFIVCRKLDGLEDLVLFCHS